MENDSNIYAEVVERYNVISEAIAQYREAKFIDIQLALCNQMIEQCKELLQYEERQIDTVKPPPSELIKLFSDVRDELADKIANLITPDISKAGLTIDMNNFIEQLSPEGKNLFKKASDEFVSQNTKDGRLYSPLQNEIKEGIEKILKKIDIVPLTQFQEIFDEVYLGVKYQEKLDQFAKRISKYYDNIVDSRSHLIAQTISNYAVNYGNLIAAKDSQIFKTKL